MTTIAGGRPAAKPADEPVTHQFSCNSCQVAFRNADLQKSHMKGEWHRYNLKRRVVNLPPISSDLFAEKTLQNRAGAAAEAGRAGYERSCDVCQKTYFSENAYQNHVGSQKHKQKAAKAGPNKHAKGKVLDDASTVIGSTFSLGEPTQKETVGSDAEEEFSQVVEGLKKTTIEEGGSPVRRPANPRLSAAAQHKGEHPLDLGAAADADGGAGAADAAHAQPVPAKMTEPAHSLNLCLFCNYVSPTVALNVAHMGSFHNMFIPEKPYLVDLKGLLTHLEKRIRDDHACIACGKVRVDVFAVQTHMRDKGHCSIPYMTIEDQVDIGDFYDFRGTYSDSDSEDDEDENDDRDGKKRSGGAKLGAKRATKTTTEEGDDLSADGGDDGWETDSSASSLDSADLTAVPADNHIHQYERLGKHPHHSQTDPRAHHQVDGWHSHAHKHNHAVYYDESELHLPSGRSVGHRSLNRYYRQNLHSYPSLAEREKQMQLAIEAGVEFDTDDDDEDATASRDEAVSSALARRTNAAKARAVSTRPAPRNTLGLAGITDKARVNLLKVERRHEQAQITARDKGRIKFSANSIGQSFRFLGRT